MEIVTREELLQIAKPIFFNTQMVKAIQEDMKKCTRRLVKFQGGRNPNWTGYTKEGLTLYNGTNEPCNRKPQYQVGDILYVRETWHKYKKRVGRGENCHIAEFYGYRASIANSEDANEPWKPSIHMPKEAARIFLKVTDVRVERLQDITEEQAEKEGCQSGSHEYKGSVFGQEDIDEWTAIEAFADVWNSTIKKSDIAIYGWNANPFVWVFEFEVISIPK